MKPTNRIYMTEGGGRGPDGRLDRGTLVILGAGIRCGVTFAITPDFFLPRFFLYLKKDQLRLKYSMKDIVKKHPG